jgi:hypothetical protein
MMFFIFGAPSVEERDRVYEAMKKFGERTRREFFDQAGSGAPLYSQR